MALPDSHMHQREIEKQAALADIAGALHRLQDERRNPDPWERVHLTYALSAVFSGCYTLARSEVQLASIAPDQRSQTATLPNDAIFGQLDLPLLEKMWRAAQAEPVKPFPQFGTVELKGSATEGPGKAWLL